MAINNAMRFIRESQTNKELRQTVNQCQPIGILQKLTDLGYEFTMDEFEESVNMLHVKCQYEEDANQLMQTSMWFKMQFK